MKGSDATSARRQGKAFPIRIFPNPTENAMSGGCEMETSGGRIGFVSKPTAPRGGYFR